MRYIYGVKFKKDIISPFTYKPSSDINIIKCKASYEKYQAALAYWIKNN